ncbi:MAG: hypothetical protein ACJ72I_19660 [Pseudonocardiaceae bacterium]
MMTTGEDFPSSWSSGPSVAAAVRRAGPVLAPLRVVGPAAAHNISPATRERESFRVFSGRAAAF